MKEHDLEKIILQYLGLIPGSFTAKINLGGKLAKINGRSVMMPFRSPYTRRGMSDIQFIKGGKFFVFEVKTAMELKHVKKHYDRYKAPPESFSSKTHKHLSRQVNYVERIKDCGGFGGFVSTVRDVQEILATAGVITRP